MLVHLVYYRWCFRFRVHISCICVGLCASSFRTSEADLFTAVWIGACDRKNNAIYIQIITLEHGPLLRRSNSVRDSDDTAIFLITCYI